ncbi:hypothetical protein BKA61DRAFT_496842 [Leptodontidium sp. MPI-SDFR-AT-0119]|nr:hypothetical protein BKA61DRAFT_496842 [Leptodontidium sp. MPI-SDFR-AT-0119]
MAQDQEGRLVIGIDYGTTYTSVAFAYDNGKGRLTIRDIQLVTDWPGPSKDVTDNKVPSEVAYSDQKFEWGNKIRHRNQCEAWTKLLLDETYSKGQLKPAPQLAKEPEEIVADFLSGIQAHLQSVLEARFGPMLQGFRREVVITVPAVWSERAKNLMYKAVRNAGFNIDGTRVSMITDHVLLLLSHTLFGHARTHSKSGDHFVVCDARGGAVVRLQTRIRCWHWEVSCSDLNDNRSNINVGAKCGAIFVDLEFKLWLRRKLGIYRFRKIRKERLNAGSRMMRDFESAKKCFEGHDEETFFLWMPPEIGAKDDPIMDVVDGEMQIDSDCMREIFDPCVNQILTLIDGQIEEVTSKSTTVKYVLLTGGFGKSKYLLNRMRNHYSMLGIEVIRPSDP